MVQGWIQKIPKEGGQRNCGKSASPPPQHEKFTLWRCCLQHSDCTISLERPLVTKNVLKNIRKKGAASQNPPLVVSDLLCRIFKTEGKAKTKKATHTLKTYLQVASFPSPWQYPREFFLTCPACEEPRLILADPEGRSLAE